MCEDPVQISHGGSQGFKSPHLHPQPCRSERRQRRAGDAHCRLRPRCGRKLKSQCSPKALRGQPTQAQASHNDHAAWSPPAASRWAILARIQPLPVGLAQCKPPPTTTTKSKSTLRWPSTACANFERQAPTSGRRRAVMNMAGDHADPGHPKPYGCRPPPHPATSLPVGHRDAQTPDAGQWTPGRSDARTGHRSPGQAPVGHRTLAPDTGHRMPDTNADTVTTPQPASGPPWPPCRATAR
jgi:hypothetical protein